MKHLVVIFVLIFTQAIIVNSLFSSVALRYQRKSGFKMDQSQRYFANNSIKSIVNNNKIDLLHRYKDYEDVKPVQKRSVSLCT